jgi:very-short-patch-repair endonuclease
MAAKIGGALPAAILGFEYFADYACVPLKPVVEVDGPAHDTNRDSIRDHRIERKGYDVLRFSVQEIDENLDGVVSTIYDVVQLKLMAQQV